MLIQARAVPDGGGDGGETGRRRRGQQWSAGLWAQRRSVRGSSRFRRSLAAFDSLNH
ncbi:MAG TPA: hypothetical protein P5260_16465 [Candidatus Competibacter sp.]|nr:hypothetical protein [Candidatus Competibacter sp.]